MWIRTAWRKPACPRPALSSVGIDFYGDRLVGAVIVGVGLPKVNRRQELLREYYEKERGDGFSFAYRFPGMNKVMQAAGRVIRSETDRGAVLLIDSRFSQQSLIESGMQRSFPAVWTHSGEKTGRIDYKNINRFSHFDENSFIRSGHC